MESGIYKLAWKSGYFYFGQALNLTRRKYNHIRSLGKGSHYNKKMQNVFNKHGEPDFIIIELCPVKDLTRREQIYIDAEFKNKFCCNMRPDASSFRGFRLSKRRRKLLSDLAKTRTGVKNPNYGNRGEKNSMFGIVRSARTRKLMGDSQLGELNCMYGRRGELSLRSRLVLHTETGIYYHSIKIAAESYHRPYSTLVRQLANPVKYPSPFTYV